MTQSAPVPYLRTRLSVQMFLQFATWGAWAPVLFTHLKNIQFTDGQASAVMSTGPLAIMISPLIAGQIADRYFSTERFLSFSYFGAGVLLLLASFLNGPEFGYMYAYCLGSMLLFGPTLGLGNSICFHHLPDARSDFPKIRVWGTIGWIATAFLVSGVQQWFKIDLHACLYTAATLCFINSLYCLTLPHTPPMGGNTSIAKSEGSAIGKIFGLLRDPSFALFTIIAFFMLVFATPYYFKNSDFFKTHLKLTDTQLGPVQTIGQMAEIGTMFILPFAYKFLGPKKTIAIGLAAWSLRFAIFALGEPANLVIAAQGLHGVCFAFGIAGAMIYFDSVCEPDARASMQSFLTWVAYGLGMFVGSFVMVKTTQIFTNTATKELDWHMFWAVPAIGCALLVLIFLVGFKEKTKKSAP